MAPMIFVFGHTKQAEGLIEELPRLYAYPKVPNISGDELIILDSGAFMLGQQKRTMDEGYIRALRKHYRTYTTKPNVIPIAPDEYLNPTVTVKRFRAWTRRYPDIHVAPVIQCTRPKHLDAISIYQQFEQYARYAEQLPVFGGKPFIAFSNPGLSGMEFTRGAILLQKVIHRTFPNGLWLHILGAGWTPSDVQTWSTFPIVDSIDSLAWYADQPVEAYHARIRAFSFSANAHKLMTLGR